MNKYYLSIFRPVSFIITSGVCTTYLVVKNLNARNVLREQQLKLGNEILPVPKKIGNLIDEVIQDMKLREQKIKVTTYMTNGTDLKSNSSIFESEILIGIPQYFTYDLDDNNFTAVIDEKEISNDAPEYQLLKHSMCLSNEAKKYAIAYKINEAQHSDIYPIGVLPVLIILHCHVLSFLLERFPNPRYKATLKQHVLTYSFAPLLFVTLEDLYVVFKEYNANLMAANLGKSYIEGGIEFYKKMIQRNKISKALNKKAPFTNNGDITSSLIRKNHLPLHKRLTYLEECMEGKQKSFWHYLPMY